MKSHNQREIGTSLPPPYLVSRQSKKRKWLGAVASLISFLVVVVVDVIVNAVKGREMRSYYFVDLTWKETAQLHFSSPSQQAHRRALSHPPVPFRHQAMYTGEEEEEIMLCIKKIDASKHGCYKRSENSWLNSDGAQDLINSTSLLP